MKTLERLLSSSVAACIRYPLLCVVCLLFTTLVSLWQLQHLSFDSSAESFLKPDDPERLDYLTFENQYGLSAYFIVLVRDEALFTVDGIDRLQRLHQALEQHVAELDSVESLLNARFISSEGDDILIDVFLPAGYSDADLAIKRQQAIDTPYFLNRLVNGQGTAAAILLKLNQYTDSGHRFTIDRVQATMADIRRVLKQQQSDYRQPLLLGGSPAIGAELTRITKQEMLLFTALASLMIAVMLFTVFRRGSAVVLPLFCLFATVVMVLAMMAAGHFSVQVSSVILPSFLMAVGIADAVHFLRAFYPAFDHSGQRQQAIMQAIQHTGVAMFFTTLTTSLGLLSFAASKVTSIASFGLFAATGVWLAFLITVIALPAMLMLAPLKKRPLIPRQQSERMQLLVQRYVRWINRYSVSIITVGMLLLLLSTMLASKLVFSLNMLEWFDKQHSLRRDNQQIEQQMAGTMQVEILISRMPQAQQPLELSDLQQVDQWLDNIQQAPPQHIPISSAVSVLNLLKEANQVLQPEAGYRLPQTQQLMAQQLLLLSFDADNSLDKVMNPAMSEIRITLSVPWMDSLAYSRFVAQLSQRFYQQTQQLQLKMTGMATLSNKAFTEMTHSMLHSYIYAGISILLLLFLLAGRVSTGLMALLPNILPVAMVLAVMYLCGIALDMFTMLIGSIAIGLIVDDSIHLLYSFKQYYRQRQNTMQAMTDSLLSTGRALASTTLVLCFAFLIYCLSSLTNLTAFGFLTALCIALALVADLLLLPAILLRWHKQ